MISIPNQKRAWQFIWDVFGDDDLRFHVVVVYKTNKRTHDLRRDDFEIERPSTRPRTKRPRRQVDFKLRHKYDLIILGLTCQLECSLLNLDGGHHSS